MGKRGPDDNLVGKFTVHELYYYKCPRRMKGLLICSLSPSVSLLLRPRICFRGSESYDEGTYRHRRSPRQRELRGWRYDSGFFAGFPEIKYVTDVLGNLSLRCILKVVIVIQYRQFACDRVEIAKARW